MQPDLPATLVQAVDRALSPDPGDRFPGAEAMRDALSAVTTGTTSPPCPEPDARVASRSWRPTAAPMRVALAGVLLVGVIAVVVTLRGGWRDPGTATSPLSFSPGDWVLVTALENRAGIDVLDGTLEYALRQALAASPVVQVASPACATRWR